jgi:hypothetical protein
MNENTKHKQAANSAAYDNNGKGKYSINTSRNTNAEAKSQK